MKARSLTTSFHVQSLTMIGSLTCSFSATNITWKSILRRTNFTGGEMSKKSDIFSTKLDAEGRPICGTGDKKILLAPIVFKCERHGHFNTDHCPECKVIR